MKLKLFIISIFFIGNLQAAPIVGSIQDFNCDSKVYTHTRNGKNLPVYHNNKLQEGDIIAINSEKNTISFKLSYEKQIPKVTAETSYTVTTPPALLIQNLSATCPPEAYKIQRNAEIIPIPIWLSIGDSILVNKEIPFIKLKLGNKELVINHNNSPYTIKSTQPISWWSKLLDNIGETITGLQDEKFKQFTTLLHNRGVNNPSSSKIPAPYTLLLKKRRARKIVASIKPLYLAWNSGKAPYNIILKRGKKEVFSITSPERRIKTTSVTLKKGENYKLQICDAQKKCSNYKFTVVNQPDYPPELTDITAKATWLAAQNRKWYFEAYQQLAPLAEKEGAARIVRNALEQGARIKLPKN